MEWIFNRGEHLKELMGSENAPWVLQKPGNVIEISVTWTLEEKLQCYKKILSTYNNNMLKATTPESKVELIAQHMQDIECLHFFKDGNCRMVYLLLNKELMKNELSPAILLNPNFFDQMHVDDLCKEITDGQEAFKKFLETGLPYENCLKQEDIVKNIKTLPAHFELTGDDDFTFKKSFEFTEETAIIFGNIEKYMNQQKPSSFEKFEQFWNTTLQALLAYEAIKAFNPKSTVSCNGFFNSKNHENYINFLNKPGKLEDPRMDSINNYLELLNYGHVKDYIFSNTDLKEDKFDLKLVISSIKKYLKELSNLSAQYAEKYTFESFTDTFLKDDNLFSDLTGVSDDNSNEN